MNREQLADYSHEAWSGWMRYMFKQGTQNADGTWTTPAEKVQRWMRQMNTPYADLPESEKRSDRKEADEIIAIVGKQNNALQEQLDNILSSIQCAVTTDATDPLEAVMELIGWYTDAVTKLQKSHAEYEQENKWLNQVLISHMMLNAVICTIVGRVIPSEDFLNTEKSNAIAEELYQKFKSLHLTESE